MKAFIAMVTLLLTLSFSVASPNKASASDPTPEQIQATLDILRTLPDNPALTAVVGVLQARLDAAHPTEPLPNNLQQAAHRYDCNTCSLRSGLPPELIDQENIISICGCKRIIVKSADDSKLAFLKVRISAAADQNIFNSNIRPGEQADILVPVYQGRAIANVAILAYYGYKGVGKTKDEVNRKLVRRPLVSTNIDLANLTHELQNTKIYNNTLLRNTLAIEVTGNRHQQIITNLTREEQVVTSRNYVANRDIAHEDRQSTRGPRFFGLIHNYDATIFNIGRMTARTVINGLYITGQLYHKYYGSGTNSSHTVNQSKDKTSIDSIGVERYVNNAIKSRYEGETWSSRINKGTTHVERVSLPINEIVGNNGRVHVAFFLENQGKHNKHSVKGIRGRKVAFKSRAFSSAGDNNSYNEYWAVAGIQNDNGKKKQFEKFMGRHGALAGDSEYSTNGMITKDLPSYLYEPKVPKIYRLKQGSTHSNPINDLRARPVLNTTNATITLVDPASGEAPANNSQSATANNAQQAVALAFGAQRFAANQKYDCAKCTMRGSHQGPSGADRQAIMESCGCKSFAINIVDPNLRIRSNISSAGAERIVNSTRGGYFGVLVPTAADGSAMVRVKLENVTTSTAKTVIDTNIDLREGNVSFRLPVRPGSPASYLAHTDRYDCSKCKVLGSSGGSSPSNADKNNMMNVCGCKKLAVTINPIPGVQTVRVNTRSRGDENLHNYNANITNGKSFSILVPRDARGKAMNHLKVEAMEGANQYRTLIDEHVDLAEEVEGNTYTVTIPENGQSASGPESDQAEGTPQQAFNGSPSYSAAAPAAAAVDVATTTAKYDCARCKVRSSSTGSSPSGADKTAMIELCGCKRLAVNIAPIPGVQTVKVNTQSRGDENLHNVNYNITNGKSFSILVPRDEQGIIMVHLKVEAMEGQNQYRTLIDQHLNLAQETQSGTHTVSLPEQDTQSSTGSSAAPNNNNNQTSQDNNNQTSQDNNNQTSQDNNNQTSQDNNNQPPPPPAQSEKSSKSAKSAKSAKSSHRNNRRSYREKLRRAYTDRVANIRYDCAKCTMRGSHQGPSGADRQAVMESCGCKSFAINIVDPNLRIRSNISSAGAERIVNSTRGGYFGVLVPTAADGSAMVRVKLENVTTSTAKTVIDTNIDLREGSVAFRLPVRPGSPASYLAHTDRYDCSKCKVLGSSRGSSPSNVDKNNMMNVCGCKKLAVTINPIPGVQTVRVNTRSRGDENLHNYNYNITNGHSFTALVPRDARGKAMNHLKVEAMEGANQYRTLIDEHVDLAEEAEGNTYTVTIPENG